MRLIVATSNKHKLSEMRAIINDMEVIPYSDLIEPFEVIECGKSFKENAIIKAKSIWEALSNAGVLDSNSIVLSDDSGICVSRLGEKPGIYSARYAGNGASDKDNLEKLVGEIRELEKKYGADGWELVEINRGMGCGANPLGFLANFCCCVALCSCYGIFSVHGFVYGRVISDKRGNNGFGYDPIFIPYGLDKTLAELSSSQKNSLSHRFIALQNAKLILNQF